MHAALVHKMLLIALDKTQDKQRIVAELLSSLIIRDALLVPRCEGCSDAGIQTGGCGVSVPDNECLTPSCMIVSGRVLW